MEETSELCIFLSSTGCLQVQWPKILFKGLLIKNAFAPKSRNEADSGCKRQSEGSVSFVMNVHRTIPRIYITCIKIIRFSKAISKALCHEHCILPTHVKYFSGNISKM